MSTVPLTDQLPATDGESWGIGEPEGGAAESVIVIGVTGATPVAPDTGERDATYGSGGSVVVVVVVVELDVVLVEAGTVVVAPAPNASSRWPLTRSLFVLVPPGLEVTADTTRVAPAARTRTPAAMEATRKKLRQPRPARR